MKVSEDRINRSPLNQKTNHQQPAPSINPPPPTPRTKMANRAGRSGGGARNAKEDDVDILSKEELAWRPEVRIINKYAIIHAYIRTGLKGIGGLALLWATVVLLGGFVSVLNRTDFWYLTSIAFVQAAGLSDAPGDDRFMFFGKWIGSLVNINISSSEENYQHEQRKIKRPKRKTCSIITDFLMFVVFFPVADFTITGPIICIILSSLRLHKQDYGGDGDASKANLKPALNLFYCVSIVHSVICYLVFQVETFADDYLVDLVCQRYGFNPEVLDGYFQETKRMCVNNPASTETWNLITYGAGLLDSELPEDYAFGLRVVTMLIEQGIPIRRVLIWSPRRRIQKLIGALVWRSSVDGETRWLAARIVEHIAGDLNLAQFPGAAECMASLIDISSCINDDHEAHQLLIGSSKVRRRSFISEIFRLKEKIELLNHQIQELSALWNGGREDSNKQEERVDGNAAKERPENTVITNGDLILLGLRIFENLADDPHNCTEISRIKDLISKIVAPVISSSLTEDIHTNGAWIEVVGASLKVVSSLMRAPGENGKEMCRQIANSSNAVGNLEAILGLPSSSTCILELQMRALEVLAQLFSHGSTNWAEKRRGDFIKRALHIFLTVEWMEYYLAEKKNIKIDKETSNQPSTATWIGNHFNMAKKEQAEKNIKSLEDKKMKEGTETASQLKEKAGEVLVMLSMGSQSNAQDIRSFEDSVNRLTEMLDCNTIKCKISETEIVEAKMKIGCRISAAAILRQLCPHFTITDDDYVKQTTLKKILVELRHIRRETQEQENGTIASTLRSWEHGIAVRNNIESSRDGDKDKASSVQTAIQGEQSEERRLQAALLSLCANLCAKYNIKAPDLTTMLAPQITRENFVGRLKKMVEENSHAMPACLAILKLTCQMVEELISDDQTSKEIIGMLSQIVAKLSKASETMASVESCMLFAGMDNDHYGVPVKPLFSVLVKQAKEHLEQKKADLGINTPTEGP